MNGPKAAVGSEETFLTSLLERPLAPQDPEVVGAIESGPMDSQLAVPLGAVDRLLDPEPLAAETGWTQMPDAVGYIAVRTPMPSVTAEMVDWWFDWHPRSSLRYRVWHPQAHTANSVDEPSVRGAKAHWGTVHHPVEDVGTGSVRARISFVSPTEFGFSTNALDDPNVATIVCGRVGDHDRHAEHSLMAHVWLNDGQGGTVLRSHFWLGSVIRPDLPGALGDLAGKLVNRPFVRRKIMPEGLPQPLARHCAEEYTNLAAILPELHAKFA